MGKATHLFPSFTIRFLAEHTFINFAGAQETLTKSDNQGTFHWRNGQGRLTIDALSFPLAADGSKYPHFSAKFSYQSPPIITGPTMHA
jgi:hypothetical protein